MSFNINFHPKLFSKLELLIDLAIKDWAEDTVGFISLL